MTQPRRYSHALQYLRSERDAVVARLSEATHTTRDELVKNKRDLEQAIRLLELASKHDVTPHSRVLRLPLPSTLSPSSQLRVIEDQESDDPADWLEVQIDGALLRPLPGSVLFEPLD